MREIHNYDDYERQLLVSQKIFEKSFGQSSVFIASTLMENGGVPESTNPAALIKELYMLLAMATKRKLNEKPGTRHGASIKALKSVEQGPLVTLVAEDNMDDGFVLISFCVIGMAIVSVHSTFISPEDLFLEEQSVATDFILFTANVPV